MIFIINDNQNPEIPNGGNHWWGGSENFLMSTRWFRSVLAYSQDTRGFHYYDSLQNRSDHVAREVSYFS